MNKKTSVAKLKRREASKRRLRLEIPTYKSDTIQTLTYRYYVDSSVTTPHAFSFELPRYPYGISFVTATPGTVILPMKSVAIRRIRMWNQYDPSATSIAGNTISLRFTHSDGVPEYEFSSTASNLAMAFIDFKPKPNSRLGWFYERSTSATNPIAHFVMLHHTILEIKYAYVLSDGGDGGGKTASISTGTSSYYVYTNNLNTGLLPVGKELTCNIAY